MAFPSNTKRTAKLNSNFTIPLLGFSVSTTQRQQQEESDSPSSPSETTKNLHDTIKTALEIGYRHFDFSFSNSNSSFSDDDDDDDPSKTIGSAILSTATPREEIFLSAKLRLENGSSSLGNDDDVQGIVEKWVRAAGVGYLDAVLIEGGSMHGYDEEEEEEEEEEEGDGWDVISAWMEMQKLLLVEGEQGKRREDSLVRSIGVVDFSKRRLERMLGDERCFITPSINQISFPPSLPSNWKKHVAFNTSQGIHTRASFSSAAASYTSSPFLANLAKRKGKSVEQILVRWALHRGWSSTTTVICGDLGGKGMVEGMMEEGFKGMEGWGLTVEEVVGIEGVVF